MKKGGNILYFVIFIIVIAVIVLIYNSVGIYNVTTDDNISADEYVDMAQLAQEYKDKLLEITPKYQDILDNKNLESISDVKAQLLELKMPKEYRDVHAKLVLLLDSLKENTDFAEAKIEFEKLIASYK